MKISIEKKNHKNLKTNNSLLAIFKSIFTQKEKIEFMEKADDLNHLENLLENHNPLDLNIEYDNFGIEGNKMKDSFTESVLGYTDFYELGIFKVKTTNTQCEINENYFTSFCIELNEKIILQRIFRNKESKISSELIAFEPNSGKVEKYGEIGNCEIHQYYPKNKSLIGGNHNEQITIRFGKPIVNKSYN